LKSDREIPRAAGLLPRLTFWLRTFLSEGKSVKQILILMVVAGTVSFWAAYAQNKAKTPQEVAACEQKVEAADKQTNACAKVAQKSCADKNAYTKGACEKTAVLACLTAAKKPCSA
jgi:hypothetical protein